MPEPSLAGKELGPEWRVAAHVPGERLVLEKDPAAAMKRARGATVVSVGSLAVALALVAMTPESLALVSWPVAALFFIVAALGVPTTVKALRQRFQGVRLEVKAKAVTGWPVATGVVDDVRARAITLSAADVEAVSLKLASHPPLTLAMLEVISRDGRRLLGPEVATEAGAPSPLVPVAETLAALMGVPLKR